MATHSDPHALLVSGLRMLALVMLFVVATVGLAEAQCAMCGKNAEYAGGDAGNAYATLLKAALVLLVPTVSMLGGVAVLLWKYRN